MRTWLFPVLHVIGCVYRQQTDGVWIYDGDVSITVNGKVCNAWAFNDDASLINTTHNFCRNPDGDSSDMWCYTDGMKEYCDVGIPSRPICANQPPGPSTVRCNPPPELVADSRVVGGVAAFAHEFPFFAVLMANGQPFCGAALIAPNWLLTAAHCHCVDGTPANIITAKINPHDLQSPDSCEEERKIVSIHSYPGYDFVSKNDFCLLQLDSPSRYEPIPLRSPSSKDKYEQTQQMLTVMGFGTTATQWVSPVLQKTQVPVVATQPCLDRYGLASGTDRMCAGYFGGRIDTCGGDSGGPLVKLDSKGFTMVGVLIGGATNCAQAGGLYGVYGRVTYAYNWIQSTMKCASSERCYECASKGCAWIQAKDSGMMGCAKSCEGYNTQLFTCYNKKAQCPELVDLEKGTCWRRCTTSQVGIYTTSVRPRCQCDAGCVARKDCCADRPYHCWPFL